MVWVYLAGEARNSARAAAMPRPKARTVSGVWVFSRKFANGISRPLARRGQGFAAAQREKPMPEPPEKSVGWFHSAPKGSVSAAK